MSGYYLLASEILLLTCEDLELKTRKGGGNFKNRQNALAFSLFSCVK